MSPDKNKTHFNQVHFSSKSNSLIRILYDIVLFRGKLFLLLQTVFLLNVLCYS